MADGPVREALEDLLQRIDLDRAARQRLVDEVRTYFPDDEPDRPVVALMAVDLDRYYTCLEATLETVIRVLDGVVPSGAEWHRALLDVASQPGDSRPALVSPETMQALLQLLRFRHFMRHAYAVDLDWAKLRPLATQLPVLNSLVSNDLKALRSFLESCLTHS